MISIILKGQKVWRTGLIVKEGKLEQVRNDDNGHEYFWPVKELDKLEAEQYEQMPSDQITVIPAIDRLEEVVKYLELTKKAGLRLTKITDANTKHCEEMSTLLDELTKEATIEFCNQWGITKPEF